MTTKATEIEIMKTPIKIAASQ